MKRLVFCLMLLLIVNLCLFSEDAENNPGKDRKFTIQTSPYYYMADLISLGGEYGFLIMDLEGQYKINDLFNVSLNISFLIEYVSHPSDHNQEHIKPMFIYRPYKTGLKGFYIGFYPIIGFVTDIYFGSYPVLPPDDPSSPVPPSPEPPSPSPFKTEIGAGVDIGYKWIFGNGFTLQLGGGIGKSWLLPYDYFDYSPFSSDGRIRRDYFDVSFDFKFGYSF